MTTEQAQANPQVQNQTDHSQVTYSKKDFVPACLLCFFFGTFGVHRFYVGKVGTGILQLLTLGGFGIWALIDLIMIVVGNFNDKEGLPLKR